MAIHNKGRPHPEMFIPGTWVIRPGNHLFHGNTDIGARTMTVPFGEGDVEMAVRQHEVTHTATTLDYRKMEAYCKRNKIEVSKDSINAGEDFTCSHIMKWTDPDMYPVSQELLMHTIQEFLKPPLNPVLGVKPEPDLYSAASLIVAHYGQFVTAYNNLSYRDKFTEALFGSLIDLLTVYTNKAAKLLRRPSTRSQRFKQLTLPLALMLDMLRLGSGQGDGKTGRGKPPITQSKDAIWGVMQWKNLPLVEPKDNEGAPMPRQFGIEIVAPEREYLDDKIFTEPIETASGSVLLDYSGSMELQQHHVRQFARDVPAGELLVYSGWNSYGGRKPGGEIFTAAKDGACIKEVPGTNGWNVIDLPALEVLASRPEPRYWVSDGLAARSTGSVSVSAMMECAAFCKEHRITRIATLDKALDEITTA